MDRKYIDDNHLVPRYLADQLSDTEREAFEAFCRANPELFREIEGAARFKLGLANLDEAGKLQPLLDASPAAKPFLMRHAAVVAGLVVGAGVLYGSVVSLRVPPMGASVAEVSGRFRDALPVVGEIELMRMRAAEIATPTITVEGKNGVVVLKVLPDDESATRYDAELRRIEAGKSNVLASAEDLIADSDKLVPLYLSTREIESGEYEVAIVPSGKSLNEGAALRIDIVVR